MSLSSCIAAATGVAPSSVLPRARAATLEGGQSTGGPAAACWQHAATGCWRRPTSALWSVSASIGSAAPGARCISSDERAATRCSVCACCKPSSTAAACSRYLSALCSRPLLHRDSGRVTAPGSGDIKILFCSAGKSGTGRPGVKRTVDGSTLNCLRSRRVACGARVGRRPRRALGGQSRAPPCAGGGRPRGTAAPPARCAPGLPAQTCACEGGGEWAYAPHARTKAAPQPLGQFPVPSPHYRAGRRDSRRHGQRVVLEHKLHQAWHEHGVCTVASRA